MDPKIDTTGGSTGGNEGEGDDVNTRFISTGNTAIDTFIGAAAGTVAANLAGGLFNGYREKCRFKRQAVDTKTAGGEVNALSKSNVQFWNNHFLKVFLNYNKTAVIASTGMDPCNQHTTPLQLTPTASVPSKNPISVPVRRPISDLLLMPELIVTIC